MILLSGYAKSFTHEIRRKCPLALSHFENNFAEVLKA